MLTRNEVIGRLCQLQAKVCHELLGADHPNDCFCFDREMGGRPTEHFVNSGKALEYIEQAVGVALADDKEVQAAWLLGFKAKIRERVLSAIEEVG